MVQIYRAARWPKVPCFRQATPELNEAIEQKKFKKIKAESGSSELKNLLDLANNETDIFICEVSVCQYYLLNDPETHAIKDKIDYINKPAGDIRPFRVGFPRYLNDAKKDDASLKLRDDFNSKLSSLSKEFIDSIYLKYNIKSSL